MSFGETKEGTMPEKAHQTGFDFLEDRCACCGAPATLLCDFVIGREWTVSQWWPGSLRHPWRGWQRRTGGDEARHFTCDRPLCDACAIHQGNMFLCGKEGGIESIDHCPEHAGKHDSLAPVISEEEAAVLREGKTATLRVTPRPT
jgi:hypothetical protein